MLVLYLIIFHRAHIPHMEHMGWCNTYWCSSRLQAPAVDEQPGEFGGC